MALAVTRIFQPTDIPIFSPTKISVCELTFGNSYTFSGEDITPMKRDLGMRYIKSIVAESAQGYGFEYDLTNEKYKVFAPAPVIVHEEVVTVTNNVGYLTYPAAHINYIATVTTPYIPIAGGVTPASGQCAVDLGFNDTTGVLTKGQRTSLTFPAGVTTAYCSYVTQAWKEVTNHMSMAKMTSGVETYGDGLTFTAGASDNIKLGTDILAMQSITWSDAGTIKVPNPLVDGASLDASLDIDIDFIKTTTFGEVNWRANDAVDTTGDIVRFVYIKRPTAGELQGTLFVNDTIADSGDTITFASPLLIYGTCGGMPMELSTKQARFCSILDVALAAGTCQFGANPFSYPSGQVVYGGGASPVVTMHADTDVDATPAIISGNPAELQTVPLEVPNGNDLSDLTVRAIVVGS